MNKLVTLNRAVDGPPLVAVIEPGIPMVDQPSLRPRLDVLAAIGAAWTIVTAVPLYASVLLQPVPVDAPPASHDSRTAAVQASIVAQWEPGPPAPQWNRKLPQGAIIDDPPFNSRARRTQPELQWEALNWSAQSRAAVSPVGQAINDPPVSNRARQPRVEWLSDPLSWTVGPRVALVQPSAVVVNDPPFSGRSLAPVLSWYGPPVCTPLWNSAVLMQGASIDSPTPLHAGRTSPTAVAIAQSLPLSWATPPLRQLIQPSIIAVNDPPFGRRPANELIGRAWEPSTPQAVWGWRIVSASDDPLPLHPGRSEQSLALIGSWEPLSWSTQQRPKFSPPSVQSVDSPPVRHAGRAIQTQSAIAQSLPPEWTVPPVRPLVQPSTVAVNDPPFSNRAREIQPELLWDPISWTVTVRDQVVQPGVAPDPPPIIRSVDRRLVSLWEPLSWSAQRAPQGVPGPSADAPPIPFRRPQFETILRSWEVEPVLVRPVAHVPAGVPAVVNDPPWHARRQYQYLTATWTADTWPTQSRIPLSVDGTNIVFVRIVGVVSGPLPTCRSITASLPTVQDVSAQLPTAGNVRGVL